ncbi:hypothetical protein [Nocardia carnea]|uniref:hypothetical protein n=1 Tax=Nocardia carnea TaxID=37328 RepID=UPI002458428B|nr:hypothetical protein [Nocardia carnea]
MATPTEVLSWDVSSLPTVATNATGIADGIIKAAGTMYDTLHNGLMWKGDAKVAAEGKADREQAQMRAIATAYDDLAAAATGAYQAMEHTLTEIKVLFRNYVHAPAVVGEDWSVSGVEDWNSEAGVQLARLPGLAEALLTADAQWGSRLADANAELERMASDETLTAIVNAVKQIKTDDPKALPDEIAESPWAHWKPDVPAMTAAAISGAMTDGVKMGLEGAAKTADDAAVLKWVQDWGKYTPGITRLGIIGNAIGTVPAIVNDIEGGMAPAEAIVSESAGTATGMVTGTVLGSMIGSAATGALAGSAVPGVGTAIGFVSGIVIGGATAYGTSKGIQWLW